MGDHNTTVQKADIVKLMIAEETAHFCICLEQIHNYIFMDTIIAWCDVTANAIFYFLLCATPTVRPVDRPSECV